MGLATSIFLWICIHIAHSLYVLFSRMKSQTEVHIFAKKNPNKSYQCLVYQPVFTCSHLTIEMPEHCVKGDFTHSSSVFIVDFDAIKVYKYYW